MDIKVRDGKPGDLVSVMDTDNKCFVSPQPIEYWETIGDEYGIKVATANSTVIGFATYHYDHENRQIDLDKIAVKPAFRRRGIGRMLFKSVLHFANLVGAECIWTVIPEHMVCPGQPDDASEWLTLMGFRAVVPLLSDAFRLCGECEDGIRFELHLDT